MQPTDSTNSSLEIFCASHSQGMPDLLRELRLSLVITAHHAGKVVTAREHCGTVNTHFQDFRAPMGLALGPSANRLAIGTAFEVVEYRDAPDLAGQLPPQGQRDALYLPRFSHVTGNIQVHEMAYGAGNELWLVNTRFSCLATLDRDASFYPRWRPSFVSKLEPSDRCHLNGLAMVEGKPKYVTALGESDEPGGWRANRARGGVLIDVESGEVACRGLSMPHSPRVYGGYVWVCESGSGTIGIVDVARGVYEPVAAAPGFTRGLEFAGRYVFLGVSQVRENALFSGLPITERLTEEQRICGVCAIDLATGNIAELLKFEGGVREIFALALLPRRFPELATDNAAVLENSFVLPDQALYDVAATVRIGAPAIANPPAAPRVVSLV